MQSIDDVTLPSSLMVITDRARTLHTLPDALQQSVRGGARWIRVREPDLDLFSYIALCHVLIDTVADPRVTWTVRPSAYAILRTAYSELRVTVHCTERDALFVAADVSTLVGRSVHASTHKSPGADAPAPSAHYLLLAPVFATDSKPEAVPIGLGSLHNVAQRGIPVVALGGITSANVAECVRAEARAVATCGYVLKSEDPGGRVGELLHAWTQAMEQAGASNVVPGE